MNKKNKSEKLEITVHKIEDDTVTVSTNYENERAEYNVSFEGKDWRIYREDYDPQIRTLTVRENKRDSLKSALSYLYDEIRMDTVFDHKKMGISETNFVIQIITKYNYLKKRESSSLELFKNNNNEIEGIEN